MWVLRRCRGQGFPFWLFQVATLEDAGKASGDCGPVVAGEAFSHDAQRVQALGRSEAPKDGLGQTGGVQRGDEAVLSFEDESLGSVLGMAYRHDGEAAGIGLQHHKTEALAL